MKPRLILTAALLGGVALTSACEAFRPIAITAVCATADGVVEYHEIGEWGEDVLVDISVNTVDQLRRSYCAARGEVALNAD